MEKHEPLKKNIGGIEPMRNAVIMRGMIAVHFLVTLSLFLCCWIVFYRSPAEHGEYFVHDRTICASYLLLLAVFSRVYAAYKVGTYRIGELLHGQLFANLMSWGITYVLACIMAQRLLNPLMGFGCLAVQLIIGVPWTIYMNKVFFRIHNPKRTVVFCRNESDLRKIKELTTYRDKWLVERYLCCNAQNTEHNNGCEACNGTGCDTCEEFIDEDIHKIMKVINEYEAVFVAGINATLRNGILKHCVETNKECYFVPHTGDVMVAGATHMKAFSVPIFRVRRSNPNPEYLVWKRAFDVFASGCALLILWPIMLVTAALIKSYDQGPALYKQTRLTKDGKTFEVLKFRSMKVNAESDGVARLASENDDRITPIGKVIRAIRFDELPQLINILRGDMSIVGPRPERPEIAEQYLKELPAFNLRLQVKAGLTGYAQVYGRYNTEPADKLKMDLMYINSMSVVEDLKIIMATVQVLFQKESTQGVQKGHLLVNNRDKSKTVA